MTEKTNLQLNKEENSNKEENLNKEENSNKEEFNKEEALEYLVWSILLNVDKSKSISFVKLYKRLNVSPEVWAGAKICWVCAQSPEFGKLVQKEGRGSYKISEYGKEILRILSNRYGEFTAEHADKIYEISKKVSIKELKEYVKSISEEA